MPTTIFISYDYSVRDIVNSLYSILKQNGITVHAVETGSSREILKQYNVQNLMRSSDVIFFFLTSRSYNDRDKWIELGMARATHKSIILIVESGFDVPKGFESVPYITWNRHDPNFTINQIINYTLKIKEDKEKSGSAIGVLLLLGALAYLASKDDDEESGST